MVDQIDRVVGFIKESLAADRNVVPAHIRYANVNGYAWALVAMACQLQQSVERETLR